MEGAGPMVYVLMSGPEGESCLCTCLFSVEMTACPLGCTGQTPGVIPSTLPGSDMSTSSLKGL